MNTRAFNKRTRSWASIGDGSELPPPIEDWVINPQFDNEEWALQIGPEFWTINNSQITTITREEYAQIMRQRAQLSKWREIQAHRDHRMQNGGYRVGEFWFHSDNTSRIQQIGILMMGQNLPPNLMWKTMGARFVQMTPTLAQQIFQAAAVSDVTIHRIAEIHRHQMLEAENPCDYDFLTTPPAWPPIFGE